MEIQLRVVFLIVGLLILLGVAVDIFRRRAVRENVSGGFSNDPDDRDLLRAVMLRRQQSLRQTAPQYVEDEVELDRETHIEPHIEPYLDSYPEEDIEYIPVEVESEYSPSTTEAELDAEPELEPEPIHPQTIIMIYIMSRNPAGFNGAELKNALQNAHLHVGRNNIFYRAEHDNGSGEQLFGAAKAVEPGYFDVDYMDREQVPGITLFMQTDKLHAPMLALDKLIRAAKQIAFVLNGELLDHERKALTLMTIDNYKAQIQAQK